MATRIMMAMRIVFMKATDLASLRMKI